MYEVEFSYPMGVWTGGSVWCGHCWTFEDAVEDFDRRIKHETIDSQKKLIQLLCQKWVLFILEKVDIRPNKH